MTIPLWTAIVRPDVALEALGGKQGAVRFMRGPVAGFDLRLPEVPIARTSAYWRGLEALSSACTEAGKPYRCHAWVGNPQRADATEGERDATAMCHMLATLSLASGAIEEAFGANAERDVWAGDAGFANPDAVEFLDRFAGVYYDLRRESFLDYVGFGDPDIFYTDRDADGDGLSDDEIPDWLQQRFRRPVFMAYQLTETQIRAKIASSWAAWKATHPTFGAFLAVGRIDKNGTQIGSELALKNMLTKPPQGMVSATAYVGNGAEGQLVQGHAGHASIQAIAQAIAADSRRVLA